MVSLDVLRGLTIGFMIMVNNNGDGNRAYWAMKHAAWNGFTPTDLVFPTFLFLVGISTVFSTQARLAQGAPGNRSSSTRLRRTVILYLLGLVVNSFPFFNLHTMRFYGVLPRIAICYFVVATLYLISPGWKDKVALVIAALIGYWLLMRFVPVPGYGLPGRDVPFLDHDGNLTAWLDRQIFSASHLYERTRDPEGLLSTIPALGTALIGLLTGLWLRTSQHARPESARHRNRRNQRRGTRRNLEHLVPDQQKAVDQLLCPLRRRPKPVAAGLIDLDRRYSQSSASRMPIRPGAIGHSCRCWSSASTQSPPMSSPSCCRGSSSTSM